MSQTDLYTDVYKKCFIRIHHPNKKDIKKIVLSEEPRECESCGRTTEVVEYVED